MQFRFRRQLHLLRRALASTRDNGWRATWRRVQRRPGASRNPAGTGDIADWGAQLWILVVDGEMPAPERDSGSLRLTNLMRSLHSAGYRVAFVADEGGCMSTDAARLRDCGIHVPALQGTGETVAWVARHAATLAAAILCRHHAAGHWLPLVRRVAPRARVVFDTVDLHFLREARGAELHADQRLARRAAATRRRELGIARRADTTWVVSPVEREILHEALPAADVRVVSNIIEEDTPGLPFAQRHGLLFV